MTFRILCSIGLFGVMSTAAVSAIADVWQGNLKDGSTVRVDPITHKPTIYYRGGSTQLWNGTHEMSDGSVIIVRDGVAVPDERMFQTWGGPAVTEQVAGEGLCGRLARKVCGLNNECAERQACGLARQLQKMAQQEMRHTSPGLSVPSGEECRKGLADVGLFPRCDKVSGKDTPCARLVFQVCGEHDQCGETMACDPARQLLEMEKEERLNNRNPVISTATGRQCTEAMSNDFFAPCK